ncbi:MAG TPA: hypothetical protein P5531_11445 [Bacteroidales bacterium]|nr:hypothetical protein [Bacteroidales bacterium]HSA44114.1 hypothetical protein [Bacteroidales bacterium]
MDTLIIQLTNQKAYKLLKQLEDLHLIRVLKKNIQSTQKLSEKYAGKLPSDIADELQQYVAKSRDEWNNSSI